MDSLFNDTVKSSTDRIDSLESRPGPLQQSHTCTGTETVLLIQDRPPWGNNSDVTELEAQGKNFCMIGSQDIGTTNLSGFKEIIIPSVQSQQYYNNLFPGGTIHPAIVDFVQRGGILSGNLATYSREGWFDYSFVGGLRYVWYGSYDNNIADNTSPLIADALPCPSGNCGQITDSELDNWSYCSHGYFTNLPPGTKIILVDELNRPVTIEYPFGNGVVIATLTTIEFRYEYGEKKLLSNDIAYQDHLAERPTPSRGILFNKDSIIF